GKPRDILHSMTTFIGGGGPRFWLSVSPEIQQLNYAQVIVQIEDKEDMPELVGPLQAAVSARIPGARVEVKQLQTNPVEQPIEILVSSQADVGADREADDVRVLRDLAGRVEKILRDLPQAARVHNDWGDESASVRLEIDPDRANLAGITNADVANSTATAPERPTGATTRAG